MPDISDEFFVAVVKMRIRKTRIARGLRQDEVANRLRMGERDYQRYEGASTRRFNPTMLKLRKIARALEVDPGELIRTPTAEELEALDQPYEPRVDRQDEV